MTRREWLLANSNLIGSLYPNTRKLYGPYKSVKDSRWRVVIYDGRLRRTRQYAKIKMEVKLERRLGPNETVDHIDRNVTHDRYSNLRVIPRKQHAEEDALRQKQQIGKCVQCKKKFELTRNQIGTCRNKAGPFCSRKCSGAYGASVQKSGQVIKRKCVAAEYEYRKSV